MEGTEKEAGGAARTSVGAEGWVKGADCEDVGKDTAACWQAI